MANNDVPFIEVTPKEVLAESFLKTMAILLEG